MAAWGCEFYLLVLKVSLTSEWSDVMIYLFYRYLWNTNHRRSLFSVFAFSSPSINFSTSLSETSANLPECSSSSEKVSMWKFDSSSRTSPVTVTSKPFCELNFKRTSRAPEREALLLLANHVSNHGDTNILTRER